MTSVEYEKKIVCRFIFATAETCTPKINNFPPLFLPKTSPIASYDTLNHFADTNDGG